VSPESESPLSLPSAVGDPLNDPLALPTDVHKEVAGNGKQKAIHPPEELRKVESERERVDEGGLTGCREAVEILTRNPKKGLFRVLVELMVFSGLMLLVCTFFLISFVRC